MEQEKHRERMNRRKQRLSQMRERLSGSISEVDIATSLRMKGQESLRTNQSTPIIVRRSASSLDPDISDSSDSVVAMRDGHEERVSSRPSRRLEQEQDDAGDDEESPPVIARINTLGTPILTRPPSQDSLIEEDERDESLSNRDKLVSSKPSLKALNPSFGARSTDLRVTEDDDDDDIDDGEEEDSSRVLLRSPRAKMLGSSLFSEGEKEIAKQRQISVSRTSASDSDSEFRTSVSGSESSYGGAATSSQLVGAGRHRMSRQKSSTAVSVPLVGGNRRRFFRPRNPRSTSQTLPTAAPEATNPVFGVGIDHLLEEDRKVYPDLEVPYIMYFLSCQTVLTGGHGAEGIFRLSIGSLNFQDYVAKLNLRDYSPLLQCNDPHVFAVLLKHFFRNLPEVLIPDFSAAMRIVDEYDNLPRASLKGTHAFDSLEAIMPAVCVELFEALFQRLSHTARHVLRFFCAFLETFLQEDIIRDTKMTMDNLAVVFQNGIVRDPDPSPTAMLVSQPKCQRFISLLYYYVIVTQPLKPPPSFDLAMRPPPSRNFKSPRFRSSDETGPAPWANWKEFLMDAGLSRTTAAHYQGLFQEEEVEIVDWEEFSTAENQQLLRGMGVKAGHCLKILKFAAAQKKRKKRDAQ